MGSLEPITVCLPPPTTIIDLITPLLLTGGARRDSLTLDLTTRIPQTISSSGGSALS